MNRKQQAEEYRKRMGDEAADRQERLSIRCPYCWAESGAPHAAGCRYYGRTVAKRKPPVDRS